MLDLQDFQFEILPTADTREDGVGFGIGLDVSVDEAGFHPGAASWTTQDTDNPTRGSKQFGVDVLNGPTWAWDMWTDCEDVTTARAAVAKIATAWRAAQIREIPGAVLAVRYNLDGQFRRVYGRPRNFDAPPNNQILTGFVPITTDFQAVDAYVYDDAETATSLSLDTMSEGGFTFPVKFPATSKAAGSQQDSITVGGDEATYPVVTFTGPITNPSLSTDEWTLSLNMSLSATDVVVVDTRPWALTALLNGSSGAKLGPRQRLSDMKLTPGIHELRFDGSSSTGGATCAVAWRSAYNSF